MNAMDDRLLLGLPVLWSVVATRSATRSARALSLSPATVLRRLSGLEEALGVDLFGRHATGLLPLPALTRVMPWVEQASQALEGLRREVTGLERHVQGEVKLALPVGVARSLLPGIRGLQTEHPDLAVSLMAGTSLVDLDRREADLALRTVRPESGELLVQQVLTFRVVVCHPALASGSDWRMLPWLTWDDRNAHLQEALWVSQQVDPRRVVLRLSDQLSLLDAAQEGLGAVFVAEPLAAATGSLVEVPTDIPMPTGALWLVSHRALRHVPRVDAEWRWVLQELGSYGGGPSLGR